jgi:hypothetical protein
LIISGEDDIAAVNRYISHYLFMSHRIVSAPQLTLCYGLGVSMNPRYGIAPLLSSSSMGFAISLTRRQHAGIFVVPLPLVAKSSGPSAFVSPPMISSGGPVVGARAG